MSLVLRNCIILISILHHCALTDLSPASWPRDASLSRETFEAPFVSLVPYSRKALLYAIFADLTREKLEESFVKIIPLNAEDTVTANIHKNKRIYLARFFTDAEKERRGSTQNMTVFECTDEAADTLIKMRDEAAEQLSYMSIGMEMAEKYQLDKNHNYLSMESGICHLRHYFLNAQTGERLPSKRGSAVSPADLMEFIDALPVCMAFKRDMD